MNRRVLFLFLLFYFSPSIAGATSPIYAWGDSLTYGVNASDRTHSWPAQLEKITGHDVVNLGFPAQTSLGIAQRMGAISFPVAVPGGVLQPQGPTEIGLNNTQAFVGFGGNALKGELDGVRGTLLNSKPPVFNRDAAGKAATINGGSVFRAIPDMTNDATAIIWACRNDVVLRLPVATCLENIARMVEVVKGLKQHFIILSVLNSANEPPGSANFSAVSTINQALSQRYPDTYLDVRAVLIDAKPGGANGIISSQLRLRDGKDDGIHLNDDGYAIVAGAVAGFLKKKGR